MSFEIPLTTPEGRDIWRKAIASDIANGDCKSLFCSQVRGLLLMSLDEMDRMQTELNRLKDESAKGEN